MKAKTLLLLPILGFLSYISFLLAGNTIAIVKICGPYYYSALISNIIAFIGIGCFASYILIKLSKNIPIFSVSLIILFLISSPIYLAFASLSMLETFGSLVQLLVFMSYT